MTMDEEARLTNAEIRALAVADSAWDSQRLKETIAVIEGLKAQWVVQAKAEVVEAAHSAADELDAWDGEQASGLGGCSPGGVVRHDIHAAAGTGIDDCPSCQRRAAEDPR